MEKSSNDRLIGYYDDGLSINSMKVNFLNIIYLQSYSSKFQKRNSGFASVADRQNSER